MTSNTMHLQHLTNGHSAHGATISPPRALPRPRIDAARDGAARTIERGGRPRERSFLRDPAVWAWLIVAMLAMIPAGAALRAIGG